MTTQAIRETVKTVKYRGRCPYCGSGKKSQVCQVCGYAGQIEEFGLYIFQSK